MRPRKNTHTRFSFRHFSQLKYAGVLFDVLCSPHILQAFRASNLLSSTPHPTALLLLFVSGREKQQQRTHPSHLELRTEMLISNLPARFIKYERNYLAKLFLIAILFCYKCKSCNYFRKSSRELLHENRAFKIALQNITLIFLQERKRREEHFMHITCQL